MISGIKNPFLVQNMLKSESWLGDIPGTKEIYRTFCSIAWPATVETVLVSLIGSVDTIMVGTIGKEAIAAVGITTQPKMILLTPILSLNIGVTAIVARRKGEGDLAGANRCLRQCTLISILLSFLLSVFGFIFAEPILMLAGAGTDILHDAVIYFQIIMVSIFFSSVSLTINAGQRGVGNTKISMHTNLASNIINLIFNYFLINGIAFFPKLNIRGAAIATALGSVAACVLSIRSVLFHTNFLDFKLNLPWSFDKKTLRLILDIGGSSLIEQGCTRIGFFIYAVIVARLGTLALATHQICMTIINLSFSFGDGLSIAASSLVGQSLGAKRPDMAIIYGKTGQRVAFIVSSVLFVLFIGGRRFFIALFSTEPDIIALGSVIMIIIAFVTHIQTSQVVITGCLRGAGDAKFVALSSLISVCIFRPFISYLLCFPLQFGLVGAWFGLMIDQTMRLVLNFTRFNRGKWTQIQF